MWVSVLSARLHGSNITIDIITLNLSIVNGNSLKFSISLPVFNILTVKRSPAVSKASFFAVTVFIGKTQFPQNYLMIFVRRAVLALIAVPVVLIVLIVLVALIVVIAVTVVAIVVFVPVVVFVVHNITPLNVLGTLVPYLV